MVIIVSHNRQKYESANKSPRLAIMLAVLCPGLDYLYLGATFSGLFRINAALFAFLGSILGGYLFWVPVSIDVQKLKRLCIGRV